MKKSILKVIIVVLVVMMANMAFAENLTAEEMGFMTLEDYAYYCGILGVVSGFAFIIGMK